jgi:hypothetical protein
MRLVRSEAEEVGGSDDKAQGEQGYGYFADEAHSEGAQALLAHLFEVGAQTNAGEC